MEAMKGIPNRSEFIRNAILSSLESACPLCKGTGILTPDQKNHLDSFFVDHSLEECEECNELYLICANKPKDSEIEGTSFIKEKGKRERARSQT